MSEESTEAAMRLFCRHIELLIEHWGSAVDMPVRERLEGLAFSFCVILDGDSGFGPMTVVDEDGNRFAGNLHEVLGAQMWRKGNR